jgi:hypothetical protein
MGSTEGLAKTTRDYARPARRIFRSALNFRCSAIATLVRSGYVDACPGVEGFTDDDWANLSKQ